VLGGGGGLGGLGGGLGGLGGGHRANELAAPASAVPAGGASDLSGGDAGAAVSSESPPVAIYLSGDEHSMQVTPLLLKSFSVTSKRGQLGCVLSRDSLIRTRNTI
jgi:hypothetical protein